MEDYTTIKQAAVAEFTEKKSRFIGSALPISAEPQAMAFIKQIKEQHRQATHNCYAYQIHTPVIQRYSDDGEPQGTAGIPMLEVLKKEQITNVVVVVTRYFGGIMLGAGGLVRAYSQAIKLAMDAAKPVRMVDCTTFELVLPYPLYDSFLAWLAAFVHSILHTDYGEMVTIQLQVPTIIFADFSTRLLEFSAGQLQPQNVGTIFAALE